jgi:hypothetical protein
MSALRNLLSLFASDKRVPGDGRCSMVAQGPTGARGRFAAVISSDDCQSGFVWPPKGGASFEVTTSLYCVRRMAGRAQADDQNRDFSLPHTTRR